MFIVPAGENVAQEGSNLKILRVTEGWFIDFCGCRKNVVQEGSNLKILRVTED